MLSDVLIDKATISGWTAIISSDELLRQLLRSFFQYAYTEWFPFHKDLFLSDMVANRTDFCSPLLVNAVLANACYSSSSLSDRSKYWLPDNLTYKFTAEAKRLWDLETASGRRRLTTVQAAQILSSIMDFDGINALGRIYTDQGLTMANDLGLFELSQEDTNDQIRKARTWTAWSLYAWHSMISYYFHQRPSIAKPPAESLPDDPQWYGDIYLQYPPSETLIPMHLGTSFKAKCLLRRMKNEIAQRAFGHDAAKGDTWLAYAEAELFCSTLTAWFEALPEHLHSSRVVFPKDIGIQYVIALCGWGLYLAPDMIVLTSFLQFGIPHSHYRSSKSSYLQECGLRCLLKSIVIWSIDRITCSESVEREPIERNTFAIILSPP